MFDLFHHQKPLPRERDRCTTNKTSSGKLLPFTIRLQSTLPFRHVCFGLLLLLFHLHSNSCLLGSFSHLSSLPFQPSHAFLLPLVSHPETVVLVLWFLISVTI